MLRDPDIQTYFRLNQNYFDFNHCELKKQLLAGLCYK